MSIHEPAQSHHEQQRSSDRAFGLSVGGVFLLIGSLPVLWHGESPRLWALAIGAALVLAGALKPLALKPVHEAWMKLAKALERITNPVVMGAIFIGVITPAAIFIRLTGKRSLKLGFDRKASTYWIERPKAVAPYNETLRRQF